MPVTASTFAALSLVADVGGTNTRCALANGTQVLPGTVRVYKNAGYADEGRGLDEVLSQYLGEMRAEGQCDQIAAAAVAIAGPVKDGAGELTNVAWTFDRATLARVAGTERVEVLNDLQAQGHALDDLAAGTLRQVRAGEPAGMGATRLVIGAGTGFNAAPVFETPSGRLVPPAEIGHVSLPLRHEADRRLHQFLEDHLPAAHGFASVEDVLSGRGLEHVYLWLGTEAGDPKEKSAAQIMAALNEGNDERAAETARIYVQMLGNVAGNLALTLLPYGGIYFIGGVVRAMLPHLARFGFDAAFCDKGRLSEFNQQFPVWVIEDDFAALTGCAVFLQSLSKH